MELTLEQALQKGIEAHKAGKAQEADKYYTAILKANPKHPDANHNMGALAVGVGKVEAALPFFKTALEVNQTIGQYWLSYIDALIKLDRIADAKAVFDQATSKGMKGNGFKQIKKQLASLTSNNSNNQEPSQAELQNLVNLYSKGQVKQVLNEASELLLKFPSSVDLYNITGAANQGLGKLEEAIQAYNKALAIKPDYADAYNNMGITLSKKGKIEEAIDAFKRSLAIKPDYAEAQTNIGNALQDHGQLEEAIKAYRKAIEIKPDFAEAHRHLTMVKSYSSKDPQIASIKELLTNKSIAEDAKCHLNFALAKIFDDLDEYKKAFKHLTTGNALRKKLLNYSIDQDISRFSKFRDVQANLLNSSLKLNQFCSDATPIFIVGMPRSGTTLIEQIISSHSKVAGAGELKYVSIYGSALVMGAEAVTGSSINTFRDKYLLELAELSDGKQYVTDKMPQNFFMIPLICAAFPEAKVIHVKRDPRAVCWSNFKHYFPGNSLNYSYGINDVVSYYKLYSDLMEFWQAQYGNKIYNLDYEKLTTEQENETRELINHLGLNWEKACLSPHKNKRNVRTASQQQVKQKLYQGSSEVWRKYEPFLNGAFDSLSST